MIAHTQSRRANTDVTMLLECGSITTFPKRYIAVLMVSMGMCITHAQRVILGVTVVTILDELPNVGTARAIDSVSRIKLPNKMGE